MEDQLTNLRPVHPATLDAIDQASPEARVEWCSKCGQVRIDNIAIAPGDEKCLLDLKVGTRMECLGDMEFGPATWI